MYHKMYIHKCLIHFRSDWTKHDHVGGVLTAGKDRLPMH